jgi:hypothetical protein
MAVAVVFLDVPALAGRPPARGPTQALQRLAEKQGHPGAAAKTLKDFGYPVPPEIEAAAAGITPEAIRQAIAKGGPLTLRLETALRRPLSADQTRRISEAERDSARQLATARQKYVQDAAQSVGLPEDKVRKVLSRDTGKPAAEKGAVAQFEKLLGHPLAAGDVNRFAAAREAFLAASQSERGAFAQKVGKIAGIPQSVVQELLR